MPTTGALSVRLPAEPAEAGVAVTEDAAVGRHEPVAPAAGRGGHPHDGRVERQAAGRAEEAGVAVTEDAAVGRHQPVAPAAGRGGHPDDGRVQVQRPGRPGELGVAVAEDPAVRGHEPVAPAVGRGGHADDRCVGVGHRVGAHARWCRTAPRSSAGERLPSAGAAREPETGQHHEGEQRGQAAPQPGGRSPRALVDRVDELAQPGVVEAVEAQGQPGELGVVVALGREGPGRADAAPHHDVARSGGSGRPARPCWAAPGAGAPAGRPPSGRSGSCGRSRGSPRRPPPGCWSP